MKVNKKQKAMYSLLLIAILLNIQPAFSYTFNSVEIKDLINDDIGDESKSWTPSKLINSKIVSTIIDGKNFLGGPSVLGTTSTSSGESLARTYKTLPKHNMIYFSLTLSVCGTWATATEGIKLMFDSVTVDRLEFNAKDFVAGKCGAAGAGLTDVVVSGRVPHSVNSLTFKAVSDTKKPSSQASFGIRELSIIFANVATTTTEVCCSSASCSALSKNQCSCPVGSYLASSSLTGSATKKCTAGHANCKTCFGVSASECYSCSKGTYFDGSKCAPCDDSCAECTGAGPTKCTKPKVVCIKDVKGNCVDSCPAPLVLDNTAKTCSSKCSTDQFIYPDGSCSGTCTTGNVLTIGCYKLCLGCKVGFINCDNICQTPCEYPSKIRTDKGIAYCDAPCPKPKFYWESNKDKCVDNCPEPWQCDVDKCGVPICSPRCDWKGKDYVWFKEQNKCVCECPKGFTVTKVQGGFMCKPVCPADKKFWEEGGEGQLCVKKCPEGWDTKTDQYGHQYCERHCCGDLGIYLHGKCVCDCPKGWKTDMVNKVPFCVPVCCDSYWWDVGCDDGVGSCVTKCPDGWQCAKDECGLDICQEICCETNKENIWSPAEKKCVCECEPGWAKKKINGVWQCAPVCECDEFFWSGCDSTCVKECPCGWQCGTGCGGIPICVEQCPCDAKENIWWPEKKDCVCDCEPGWVKSKVNDVLQCVRACDCDEFWWQGCPDGSVCVDKCPEGWKCDKGCFDVELCTEQCPCDAKENIWWPEKKKCVCECGPGWVESKINGVSQCVPACGCDEFWWCEGGKDGACVCECPEGWQCDKGCEDIPICSPKCCPTDKENIWWPEKHQCVCECGEGWVAEEVNGGLQCVKVCPNGEYWWQECGPEGACVCDCPEGFKCDKGCEGVDICTPICCDSSENIWWPEKKQCVCECGPGWEQVKVNNIYQCVPICKKGEYWWCEGGKEGSCVCECPEGWECDTGCEGIPVCSPKCCPTDKENIWWPEKNQCVCECGEGWVATEINGGLQCVKACPKGEFWWKDCGADGACVCECPEGWKCDKGCEGVDICTEQCPCDASENIWWPEKHSCVCECAPGWVKTKVNDVYQCVKACGCDEYWWCEGGKDGACLDKCPEGWKCDKGCEFVDICTEICPCDEKENIWWPEKQQCVCECGPGWVKKEINSVWQCVHVCECDQYWWPECPAEEICVEKCPEGWKCDKGCEGVDICSPICPCDDKENIWFAEKHECVCECAPGWTASEVNGVLQCVHACGCDEYWWCEGGHDGACVEKCPDGWKCDEGCAGVDICTPICPCDSKENIWFAEKNDCVCECPAGWVKAEINSVFKCVHSCECGDYWWPECGSEGACVDKCPEGWKCDKGCADVDLCSPQCPCDAKENIWLPIKHECVCDCPDGYATTLINDVKQCAPICEHGQYWWAQGGKDGACVCECPSGWTWGKGCGDIDICVPVCDQHCPEKVWFEEKGECLCECPAGMTIDIINHLPACAPICPKGELWWCEGGHAGACVHECPVGWTCSEGCGGVDICVRHCDSSKPEKIWFDEKGICVCDCPQGWLTKKVNGVLVCDHICEKDRYWWQSGGKDGACVCECPFPWIPGTGCDGVDVCVPKCDPHVKENIFFNGQCVCECPCGWEAEKINDLAACKKICPQGQYWWSAANECVCECPEGWKCGKDAFGADICVPQCDLNKPEKFWVPKDGCCKKDCPTNTYLDTVNKVLMCVEICN